MDTEKDTYIDLLEAINKSSDIDELFNALFKPLLKLTDTERIQILKRNPVTKTFFVSYECCREELIPMLSYNYQQLQKVQNIGDVNIWESQSVTDEEFLKYRMKSYLGISIKLSEGSEGIWLFISDKKGKDFKHYLDFLNRLKNQIEIAVDRIYKLNKNADEVKRLLIQSNNLREQDYLKSSFINNICHEFRTPLSSIMGFSKMLLEKENSKESIREITRQIQFASKRLSSLISDFLHVNRMNTTGWVPNFESCDIGEIVRNSVEEFYSLNKDHEITYKISSNYPTVKTDPRLVRQVLDNLISNAIKYSPDGGLIEVCVDIQEDKKSLKISVSDHGIGIRSEELSKIFDRLYRSVNPFVQNIPGSGLGLSICKEIVSALNGNIEVSSQVNNGSNFSFTLPVN